MTFDGFKHSLHDDRVEQQIEALIMRHALEPLQVLKLFPLLVRRQWLKRFVAHVELFKMTLGIPGDIAEMGVFKGAGLLTWANLLETFCIGDRTKRVIGFDNWRGFTTLTEQDGDIIPSAGKVIGGFDSSSARELVHEAVSIFDSDRFVNWKPRVELIDGEIETTLPEYLKTNPGIRFSLVHFDCDLYTPTLTGLTQIWPRVVNGGILIFDEYGIPDWPGETAAVDEFLKLHPHQRLHTFDWTNTPGAYLIKTH